MKRNSHGSSGGKRKAVAAGAPSSHATLGQRRLRGLRLNMATLACASVFAVSLSVQSSTGATRDEMPADVDQLQGGYHLGPLDKVRIRAFEWRASRDEVYEWKALNTDYAIGAGGRVSLPLIGEVKAMGLTTAQLASLVGERLMTRLGLAEPPDVSVEIVHFRPFYITGDVQKPGEYEFRPGMTLLQSISIAGGMAKADEGGALRVRRDLIAASGDLNVFETENRSLMARKARLDAELGDQAEINFPTELVSRQSDVAIAALLRQEQIYFQTRKRAHDSQVTALERLKAMLEKESAALGGQLKAHARQVDSVKQEFDSVAKLYQKGLTNAPRKLALERSLAQLEGERIRLDMELARANQEISKIAISIVDLHNRRVNEASGEMRATQTRLAEITQRANTAQLIIRETAAATPRLMLVNNEPSGSPAVKYSIVRNLGGQSTEISVTEGFEIAPGDAIKVTFLTAPRGGIEVSGPQQPQSASDSSAPAPALERMTGAQMGRRASIGVNRGE